VDSRADLYSFGVILYEMLTGATPFVDSDLDALVQRHLTVIPVPPHERQAGIPVVLSDIVMMLLQKEANESLSSANQRLEEELLQRLEVEEQRAKLNEQMLAAQKERLAELSTPLLPIARDIVVIPLIGSMDTERADQVLSVALDGAQRLGARFVILDVTGLKHVDTHTAGMLANVASALRLLGAETVITGIRPKIAQTLIALDINLQSFVTMATLQSGMEYALKRSRGGRS
jgi:anti-anti-sigma factor